MEQQHHILDMNKYFQRLLKHFELWAKDATSFLTVGRDLFSGEFIHDDGILRALLQGGSDGVEFWDDLTKQCLELIFGGFFVATKRLLFDRLEGGALDGKEIDTNYRMETSSVPVTNAQPERDFGMLDNLMKSRPRETTMALEGLIMCTNNKVSRWRDNLDEERKRLMVNIAMKSKKDQRKKYLQRLQEMKAKRTAKMAEVKETKERKEMGLRNEKEKLTKDLDDTGGFGIVLGKLRKI